MARNTGTRWIVAVGRVTMVEEVLCVATQAGIPEAMVAEARKLARKWRFFASWICDHARRPLQGIRDGSAHLPRYVCLYQCEN